MRPPRLHPAFVPALIALICGGAGAASAQGPVTPPGDFGCRVERAASCTGRVDFLKGRNFEFTIVGPGVADVVNKGNRRCRLEYSLTGATVATAGRTMDIAPGETFEVKAPDATAVILRFFNRGLGSDVCDLSVALRG